MNDGLTPREGQPSLPYKPFHFLDHANPRTASCRLNMFSRSQQRSISDHFEGPTSRTGGASSQKLTLSQYVTHNDEEEGAVDAIRSSEATHVVASWPPSRPPVPRSSLRPTHHVPPVERCFTSSVRSTMPGVSGIGRGQLFKRRDDDADDNVPPPRASQPPRSSQGVSVSPTRFWEAAPRVSSGPSQRASNMTYDFAAPPVHVQRRRSVAASTTTARLGAPPVPADSTRHHGEAGGGGGDVPGQPAAPGAASSSSSSRSTVPEATSLWEGATMASAVAHITQPPQFLRGSSGSLRWSSTSSAQPAFAAPSTDNRRSTSSSCLFARSASSSAAGNPTSSCGGDTVADILCRASLRQGDADHRRTAQPSTAATDHSLPSTVVSGGADPWTVGVAAGAPHSIATCSTACQSEGCATVTRGTSPPVSWAVAPASPTRATLAAVLAEAALLRGVILRLTDLLTTTGRTSTTTPTPTTDFFTLPTADGPLPTADHKPPLPRGHHHGASSPSLPNAAKRRRREPSSPVRSDGPWRPTGRALGATGRAQGAARTGQRAKATGGARAPGCVICDESDVSTDDDDDDARTATQPTPAFAAGGSSAIASVLLADVDTPPAVHSVACSAPASQHVITSGGSCAVVHRARHTVVSSPKVNTARRRPAAAGRGHSMASRHAAVIAALREETG